ncbi:RHS repeat domain-containing protein [Pedobacter nototheniae]|uniref:RHS repeat domain-containing protein n=1 Tax=Pedobacter nototheniae TaxID=2488994 RepID=UPI00103BC7A2|nr:RHS repeat domain-containing protein [Pedobacter nototheniae]
MNLLKSSCVRNVVVLCFINIFFNVKYSQGQRNNQIESKFLPPSPTAGSLGKYGQIPIGFYTGIPQINIPIHAVKYKELELPISLNYHASGNKPDEMPGSVGLGWSLGIGGSITRIINGTPDEGVYPVNFANAYNKDWGDGIGYPNLDGPVQELTVTVPAKEIGMFNYSGIAVLSSSYQGDYDARGNFLGGSYTITYTPTLHNPGYSPLTGVVMPNPIQYDDWSSPIRMNSYLKTGYYEISPLVSDTSWIADSNPDEYIFNFNGISGKFYQDRNGIVHVKSQNGENFKIKINFVGQKFIDLPYEEQNKNYPFISTYVNKLYKELLLYSFTITDNNGIKYTFGGTDESIEFSRPGRCLKNTAIADHPGGYVQPTSWQLTSIESPNGYRILLSYYRDNFIITKSVYSDVVSSMPLSSFRLTADGTNFASNKIEKTTLINPVHLQKIITPSEEILFTYKLVQQLGYIVPSNYPNRDILATNEDIFYNYKDVGRATIANRNPSVNDFILFSNNKGEIYKRLFFNYNGDPNKRLELDSLMFSESYGAEQKYRFEYNPTPLPNYLASKNDAFGFYNGKESVLNNMDGEQGFQYFLSVSGNERTLREQEYNLSRMPDFNFSKARILEKIIYPTGGAVKFEFEPNQYSVTAKKWPFTVVNNQNNNSIETAGLRIKKIKSLLKDGSVASEKNYYYTTDYINGGGISSGVLSYEPKFFEKFSGIINNPANNYYSNPSASFNGKGKRIDYWRWYSNAIEPMSAVRGPHITYSEVTEETVGLGFTSYKYQNFDNGFNDLPPVAQVSDNADLKQFWENDEGINMDLERGLISKESVYDKFKQKKQETIYSYNDDPNRFDTNIRKLVSSVNNELPRDYITSMRATASLIYTYFPFLKSKQVITNFENGQIITHKNDYLYDKKYGVLVEESLTNSNNQTLKTTYKYPFNFLNNDPEKIFRNLTGDNRIYMIEKNELLNNKQISFSRINYDKFSSNNLFLPKSVELQVGSNPIQTKQLFNKYDLKANVTELQQPNGIKKIYVWSYNSQHPVAEIGNCDYAVVETLLGGALAIESFNKKNPTDDEIKTFLAPLRSGLPNTQITTYTYAPLIGITSQTDPKGLTTFYEYDGFGRLNLIKDQNGNIIKTYDYHYKN